MPRTCFRHLASVCVLSPVRHAQRIRVGAAELRLETRRLSVDEAEWRVGYAESSTIRCFIRSVPAFVCRAKASSFVPGATRKASNARPACVHYRVYPASIEEHAMNS